MRKNPEYTYIYGLQDSHNKVIRYVGKANDINQRLIEHKSHAKTLSKKRHLQHWINKIQKQGYELEIVELECVKYEKWDEREKHWIQEYKNRGHKLTNISKGGESGPGGKVVFKEPFDKIKKWAQSQGIKSQSQWFKFLKNNEIPKYVPKHPQDVYKDKGWVNWGDFLGTGTIQSNLMHKNYLNYEEAKEFLKDKKLETKKDFLIDRLEKNYNNLIPSKSDSFYKNKGWEGWPTFLNSSKKYLKSNKSKNYITYNEAKKLVHKLNINSSLEWRTNKKHLIPFDVPTKCREYYLNKGWISWDDFLGREVFKEFEDCKKWIKHNIPHIKTNAQWREWSKSSEKPNFIPSTPDRVYKNKGWIGFGDFLESGENNFTKKFLSYKDCKQWVKENKPNIKTQKDWISFAKSKDRPSFIPYNIYQVYKNKGWCGLKNFLK